MVWARSSEHSRRTRTGPIALRNTAFDPIPIINLTPWRQSYFLSVLSALIQVKKRRA
ncbi:MAG: hypothetical protein RH862_10515 [Leptospiraceae bacterium]